MPTEPLPRVRPRGPAIRGTLGGMPGRSEDDEGTLVPPAKDDWFCCKSNTEYPASSMQWCWRLGFGRWPLVRALGHFEAEERQEGVQNDKKRESRTSQKPPVDSSAFNIEPIVVSSTSQQHIQQVNKYQRAFQVSTVSRV